MQTLITKETLQSKLNDGIKPAVDLLYTNYSSMLYGYVLQFIPDRKEAEKVLVLIFGTLAARLQQAFTSSLSIYCWMQVEARKIILDYKQQHQDAGRLEQVMTTSAANNNPYYLSLLKDASAEQRLVFSEIFLHGRDKEALALQLNKNVDDINRLLRESLLIMRKNLQ